MGHDVHAALIRARRMALAERGQSALAESLRLQAESRRLNERSKQVMEDAARLLDEIEHRLRDDIRLHVDGLIGIGRAPADQPTTVIGSDRVDSHESMDLVLLRRFGRLVKVSGGVRTVAEAIVDRPALVVVLGDLVDPEPIVTGLLVRGYSPASRVLIVTESDAMRRAAHKAGLYTCEPTIGADRFETLLDVIAA